MRKLLLAVTFGMLVTMGVGCITPAYSGDPTKRAQELLYTSENLRTILDTWERIWFLDQPGHMQPDRMHGGIM
ncbi:MAG: hypothetical protein PVH19_14190 [Planctomycetia bacterium]|jgi:hypothetical protein